MLSSGTWSKKYMKFVLTLFLFLLALILLGCAARNLQQTLQKEKLQSKPELTITPEEPIAGTEEVQKESVKSVIANVAEHSDCANLQPRNAQGNCPNMPPCAKKCYLNLNPANPKDCSNPPKSGEYWLQSSPDGRLCYYAFPPGSYFMPTGKP